MKVLIISDNNNLIDSLKTNYSAYEFKYYDFDLFSKNLKSILSSANVFDFSVFYTDKSNIENSILETVFFSQGFLLSRDIPVFTNISSTFLNGNFECLKTISSIDELVSVLKDTSFNILKEAVQRKSKLELIEKGIPVNFESFMSLLEEEDFYCIGKLIDAGFNVNFEDANGVSLLNHAVRKNKFEAVKILLSKGADINFYSKDRGYTPLMDSVWRGNYEIASYLLQNKANVNTLSKDDETNLIIAVGSGKVEIVKLLIENGADPDQKDSMDMSAWDYGNLFKKSELIEIMSKVHK